MKTDDLIAYLRNRIELADANAAEAGDNNELYDMNFYDGKSLAIREVLLYVKHHTEETKT